MRFALAPLALAVVSALGAPAADDADAKAAFGKMEATLRKAKSFRTEVRNTLTIGTKTDSDMKGQLIVAGDKQRIELESKGCNRSGSRAEVKPSARLVTSGRCRNDLPGGQRG